MCRFNFKKVDPHMWGFPKIRGTILGVPIIRTIIFWGLIMGVPLFWETTMSRKNRGNPDGQSEDLGPSLNGKW